jgi:hypothetical protein
MVIANWRAVYLLPYLLENPDGLSCRKPFLLAWTWSFSIWISQHPILAEHTQHVRNCAGTNTNIKGLGQNVEDPCVGGKIQAKRQKFWLWCALTTATEHAVEVETPPLAVQPAEVGPKRGANVPAMARSGVRKS